MPVNIDQWGNDPVNPSQRTNPLGQSPGASAQISPSRAAPDLGSSFPLSNALALEVIRLDKWIPLLCELHH